MTFNRSKLPARELAIAFYIVLISSAWATTTPESHIFLSSVRNAAVALFVVFSLFSVSRRINFSRLGISLPIWSFFFLWGVFAATVSGSIVLLEDRLVFLIVSAVGSLIFMCDARKLDARWLVWPLVVFFGAVFLFNISVGGMVFGFPIKFDFSYAETSYTLSAASFWAFGTVFCLAGVWSTKSRIYKAILWSAALVFLLAALSVGARGEGAAIVVLLLFFLWKRSKLLFFASVISATVFVIFYLDLSIISQFTIFARLQEVAGGYYGLRDQLLAESASLLGGDNICAITGCGFAYFQHFYGYSYGLYPHNQIVELVIVFGAPFALLFISLTFMGVFRLFRSSDSGVLFSLLWGFSAIVALKSGSVDSTSLFIPLSFMCIYHSRVVVRSKIETFRSKSHGARVTF